MIVTKNLFGSQRVKLPEIIRNLSDKLVRLLQVFFDELSYRFDVIIDIASIHGCCRYGCQYFAKCETATALCLYIHPKSSAANCAIFAVIRNI